MLVDDQSGSKDLYPYIRRLTPDCLLTRVFPPYGDIVWYGNGPDEVTLSVAVEYKKIDDVLDCIIDGRFAGHQVEGLVNHYQRRYLLVEGRLRTDRKTGILQKMKGDEWVDIVRGGRGFMYRDLEHWYTTMEEQAGFHVAKTYDEYESARWVAAKHSWWVNKGWADHDALKQFHVPPPPVATFTKPNVIRRIAKEICDIGWDRSIPVTAYFKTVREMINANAQTWAAIVVGEDKNGHKLTIGKNRAAKIVDELSKEPE